MRENQSFIGRSVGNHIVLAVDVGHRRMNTARSKGVTEGDASSKVWAQIWICFYHLCMDETAIRKNPEHVSSLSFSTNAACNPKVSQAQDEDAESEKSVHNAN